MTDRSKLTVGPDSALDLDGVLAFLPRTDEEVLDTRAWLAWLELWRCEDADVTPRAVGGSAVQDPNPEGEHDDHDPHG